MPYDYKPFPFVTPPGLTGPEPRHPVVIVGAGPIGLAAALELANHGVRSVVLDDNNVVSVGSRAICWSKRSLEILDRLGVGAACVEKGVVWKVGRTYHRDREVFNFDLLPEPGHRMPAFVNLQQYYVEEFLAAKALASDLIDLRFKNRVTGVSQSEDAARVEVETPEGSYTLEAGYVLACDGAKSPIRAMLGLEFQGLLFEERFLIADIEMEADFPSERRFWFEPEFHQGQSALLHKQPDNIYRIDLQLGWGTDPAEENKPEKIIPRIERVVGHRNFKLDWTSIYTFQCRRLDRFV
ncbi:MAG: FAD-dependent monooxygenase, partial [Albidovulum sp.]